MKPIEWKVTAQEGNARTGILRTRRSIIETPVFMPVGTQATVKGVRFEWLEDELDARIILGNTYHLFLRPGAETIRAIGGLHKFSTWTRSLLPIQAAFRFSLLRIYENFQKKASSFARMSTAIKNFSHPKFRWKFRRL
jgi:queuine tRNA-ribosyltransferase